MARITKAALDVSWFIPLGGITSPVQLTNSVITGGNISFRFVTEAGRSYLVQSTDALDSTWSGIETISGDGTMKTVTYSITGPQKYFRVRAQ